MDNEIHFFGKLLVRFAGKELDFKGRWQSLNVFSFLVLHPDGGRYWRYSDLRRKLNLEGSALNMALHRLREVFREAGLNPDVFLPTGRSEFSTGQIKFCPPKDPQSGKYLELEKFVDVCQFEKLARSSDPGDWKKAVQIYRRGKFLLDLPYQEWVDQKRREFLGLYNRLIWPFRPPCPYKEFVDRGGKELERLLDLLRQNRFVSVEGHSGEGKTSLAHALAEKGLDNGDFSKIIWASAKIERSELRVAEPKDLWKLVLRSFYEDLELYKDDEQQLQDGARRLLEELPINERCLIIVDNAETLPDRRYFLRKLRELCAVPMVHVIITTRWHVEEDLGFTSFLIEELPEGNARKLFELYLEGLYLGRSIPNGSIPDEDWEKIHRAIGGHAQPLRIAAGLLRTWRRPLDDFLSDFENLRPEVELHRRVPVIILTTLRDVGSLEPEELAKLTRIAPGKVDAWLKKAVSSGLVEQQNSRYKLASQGELSLEPLAELHTRLYWFSWKRIFAESRCLLLYLGNEALLPIDASLLEEVWKIIRQIIKRLGKPKKKLREFDKVIKALIDTHLLDIKKKDDSLEYDLHESLKHFLRSELPDLEGWKY